MLPRPLGMGDGGGGFCNTSWTLNFNLLSSWWQNGRMVAGNPCNPMIHNLAGRTGMYTEHGSAEEAIISTDVFGTKPLWCQPWGFG